MKTLFMTMVLILGYQASANDLVTLSEHKEAAGFSIPTKACYKAASTYLKAMDKVEKKQGQTFSERPFLRSSEGADEFLISGKVKQSEKGREIEITQTNEETGYSNTFTMEYPEKPTLLTFIVANGPSLQIHTTSSCAKMAHANSKVDFSCPVEGMIESKIVKTYAETGLRPDNVLFERMQDLANFHQKHSVGAELKKQSINMPDRYLRACLSMQEESSFSPSLVFSQVFPDAPFSKSLANGFGGGTSTSKIASRR